jgi:hypothetical protein
MSSRLTMISLAHELSFVIPTEAKFFSNSLADLKAVFADLKNEFIFVLFDIDSWDYEVEIRNEPAHIPV